PAVLTACSPRSPPSFSLTTRRPPPSTLFPYTTLFRSRFEELERVAAHRVAGGEDDSFGHPRVLAGELGVHLAPGEVRHPQVADEDRKSTRLNSSHDQISYAVFCLKKKKQNKDRRIIAC